MTSRALVPRANIEPLQPDYRDYRLSLLPESPHGLTENSKGALRFSLPPVLGDHLR